VQLSNALQGPGPRRCQPRPNVSLAGRTVIARARCEPAAEPDLGPADVPKDVSGAPLGHRLATGSGAVGCLVVDFEFAVLPFPAIDAVCERQEVGPRETQPTDDRLELVSRHRAPVRAKCGVAFIAINEARRELLDDLDTVGLRDVNHLAV